MSLLPLIHIQFLKGNIYIADKSNAKIRLLTMSTGIITTIAGTGTNSYNSDNIAATSAMLYYPMDVALDSGGYFPYF